MDENIRSFMLSLLNDYVFTSAFGRWVLTASLGNAHPYNGTPYATGVSLNLLDGHFKVWKIFCDSLRIPTKHMKYDRSAIFSLPFWFESEHVKSASLSSFYMFSSILVNIKNKIKLKGIYTY